MTYGSVSTESYDIVAAAGLTKAFDLAGPSAYRETFEIDIVVDGALDESFEVRPEMADDVCSVLFEAIVEQYAEKQVEVSIYDRTCPDDCREVRTCSHDPEDGA